jgi:WD40 repeat protein
MLRRIGLLLFFSTILVGNSVWGQTARLALPVAHTGEVNSVSYSRDGKYLVSASADHTVKIFEAGTGNELVSIHDMNAPINMAVFSPDMKQVMLCFSGNALVYDLESGKRLFTHQQSATINHIAYSNN